MSHPFSFLNSSLGIDGGKHYQKITFPIFRLVLQNFVFSRLFSRYCFYASAFRRRRHYVFGLSVRKKNESFTKEDIVSMIDLVIDNSFFNFRDKVFRQSIGIPMGIDPAPQMANLYLYYYEANIMEMLTKENYSAAKKFNYTRRFTDDLHALNSDGHLEENNKMGRIYPQELKLNQENQNNDKTTFLDLEE